MAIRTEKFDTERYGMCEITLTEFMKSGYINMQFKGDMSPIKESYLRYETMEEAGRMFDALDGEWLEKYLDAVAGL